MRRQSQAVTVSAILFVGGVPPSDPSPSALRLLPAPGIPVGGLADLFMPIFCEAPGVPDRDREFELSDFKRAASVVADDDASAWHVAWYIYDAGWFRI